MKLAEFRPDATIWLDYGQAAKHSKVLTSLSTLVPAGRFLWTASDEGRTIECLEPSKKGFRLRKQFALPDVFPDLPGDDGDEADLEAIDIESGTLWICGSHCRVRKQPKVKDALESRLKDRVSRYLLGCATLAMDGTALLGRGTALPFEGTGSLREILRRNAYIAPFIDLPSKENGLDIEGMCIGRGRLFLGLRGPLVDSIAIILEIAIGRGMRLLTSRLATHLVNLGGLGVRDLTFVGGTLLVLAGPVSSADEPFRLYRWKPRRSDLIQKAKALCEWPRNGEAPEGICRLDRKGKAGFAVLYDSPDPARIKGTRYRADWIAAGKMG
jgi:hypothetical protein